MQQLLTLGLGFVICASCVIPALAQTDPVSSADEPDMVTCAEQLAAIDPADLQPAPDPIESADYANLMSDTAELAADCDELEFSLDSASSTLMAQRGQLDCLGEELSRGCQDWDSPFSGQITYRMQFAGSGLSDLGDFQQGLRFDLRYREWVSDNLLLNLEIGSRDSSVFDVISGRHGNEAQLERAYVEGHFGDLE